MREQIMKPHAGAEAVQQLKQHVQSNMVTRSDLEMFTARRGGIFEEIKKSEQQQSFDRLDLTVQQFERNLFLH